MKHQASIFFFFIHTHKWKYVPMQHTKYKADYWNNDLFEIISLDAMSFISVVQWAQTTLTSDGLYDIYLNGK